MPHSGFAVRRSTLNTPKSQRARGGHKRPIVEAGRGLFVTRDFRAGAHLLDYRYKSGVKKEGDEVDWFTKAQHDAKYSAPGQTGTGTHVLNPHGSPWYYDTAYSGGIGGRANTNPGKQNARFKGSNLIVGKTGIKAGQEVFTPYSYSNSFVFGNPEVSSERPTGTIHRNRAERTGTEVLWFVFQKRPGWRPSRFSRPCTSGSMRAPSARRTSAFSGCIGGASGLATVASTPPLSVYGVDCVGRNPRQDAAAASEEDYVLGQGSNLEREQGCKRRS